jgi:hypothetical protein
MVKRQDLLPVVNDGRFDMEELFEQLQPQLDEVVPTDEIPIGREYGIAMLSFSDETTEDYVFYDADNAPVPFQECASAPQATPSVLARAFLQGGQSLHRGFPFRRQVRIDAFAVFIAGAVNLLLRTGKTPSLPSLDDLRA